MSHYYAFLKKELLESLRTFKLWIMLLIFALFGVMNPLVAKLTPTLVESFLPLGDQVTIPDPTAFDSWGQFFKNINQMGTIITLLIFSGVLISELAKGTLINVLTKGLSRKAVILAKFTAVALIWTMSLSLSFLITWAYNSYLFPTDAVNHLFFSVLCIWLFALLLISILLFASTLTNTIYGSLIIVGGAFILGLLLNILPKLEKFNPLSLATKNMDLLIGTIEPSDLLIAIGISLLLLVIFNLLAILIFNKKQI